MKKIVTSLIALPIFFICEANAQSTKKLPPPPPPKPLSTMPTKPKDPFKENQVFLKRNPSVGFVKWRSKEQIIIHLKDGKEENYNLKNENEKKIFIEQYGTPPTPPPIPPKKQE